LRNSHRKRVGFAGFGDGADADFWEQSFDRLQDYLGKLRKGVSPVPDDTANRLVERKLKITRVFDAPRRVVFKAWTDPEQLARWWGPRGFTNPLCEIDARQGGAIRIIMRAPDGVSHEMKGVFREINEPERLVFTNRAIGSQGEPLLEGLTTVSFTEQEGKTTMTLETSAVALLPEARAMLNGMNDGWNQSLERLTMVLGG
jgi:uncharacterized protein YndB with AHSA1/START domain